MSGPKYIELKRVMTRKEFMQLKERISQVVKGKNYEVKTITKTDEDHVTVTAEHGHSGDKILVTAGLHDRNIQLNIEDKHTCREIQRQIADKLGEDLVKRIGGGYTMEMEAEVLEPSSPSVTCTVKSEQ